MSLPLEVVTDLSRCFATHDVQGLARLLAPTCQLQTSAPAPRGDRIVGAAACVAWWTPLIDDRSLSVQARKIVADGGDAVVLWEAQDVDGLVVQRGVNVFHVEDGLVTSVDGYVKASR